MKSPKPRNEAQRKVDHKNYDAITLSRNYQEELSEEIIRRNYDTKLSGEIMTRNYQLVYYVAQNVGITGILAYPKTHKYSHTIHECQERSFSIGTFKSSRSRM